MKYSRFEDAYKILNNEAFEAYSDSDIVIAFNGESYAVYCNSVTDYNLMSAGLTAEKLNDFFIELDMG